MAMEGVRPTAGASLVRRRFVKCRPWVKRATRWRRTESGARRGHPGRRQRPQLTREFATVKFAAQRTLGAWFAGVPTTGKQAS